MNRLTKEQRLQIVQIYFENNGSVSEVYRKLRPFYGRHNCPSEQLVQRRRTVRTEETIAAVEQSVEEDPNESIRHRRPV